MLIGPLIRNEIFALLTTFITWGVVDLLSDGKPEQYLLVFVILGNIKLSRLCSHFEEIDSET